LRRETRKERKDRKESEGRRQSEGQGELNRGTRGSKGPIQLVIAFMLMSANEKPSLGSAMAAPPFGIVISLHVRMGACIILHPARAYGGKPMLMINLLFARWMQYDRL
jgi:hypothetical protein